MSGALSPDACVAAWRRYGHLVRRRCRAVLRDEALGDDALRETFLELLRHGGAFPQAEAPLRFLHRLADRCCARVMERRPAWRAMRGESGETTDGDPSHPFGERLEAFSVGATDPEVDVHVSACAACAAYLETLATDGRAHILAPLPDFLSTPTNVVSFERPAPTPVAVASNGPAASVPAPRAGRDRRLVVGAAAAAALFCFVLLRPNAPMHPPDLRAAGGGPTLFTVRERAGLQLRTAGDVKIRAGDRLSFELQLPAPARVSLVLFPDDGPGETLVSARALPAGTARLEATVQANAAPTHATVYFGPSEVVTASARPAVGGDIGALRIDSEAGP